MQRQPAVYMLSNRRHGTLYVGVTSDLVKRVWQHRNGVTGGFTKKYHVHLLVYYELLDDMDAAIAREKQMKRWRRAWKVELIEKENGDWKDLWPDIIEDQVEQAEQVAQAELS